MARLQESIQSGQHERNRLCRFDDTPDVLEVIPYGKIYGIEPKSFVITKAGRKKLVSATADKFTGKSPEVMKRRLSEFEAGYEARYQRRERIF